MVMTEKRFTLSEVGCYRTALILDNGEKIGNSDVVELLNMLHEELENRKQIIKAITNEYNELEQAKNSLLEENEQLKKQRYDLYKDITRLVKENEQLKSENEELEDVIELLEGKLWNCQNVR